MRPAARAAAPAALVWFVAVALFGLATPALAAPGDADDDGRPDDADNCPGAWNPQQENTDVCAGAPCDAVGDACDLCAAAATVADSDADGFGDECDRCPEQASPGNTDVDADGIGDACDSCPAAPNADQLDGDLDGVGDVCDPCPGFPDHGLDGDGDGLGDACDSRPTEPGGERSLRYTVWTEQEGPRLGPRWFVRPMAIAFYRRANDDGEASSGVELRITGSFDGWKLRDELFHPPKWFWRVTGYLDAVDLGEARHYWLGVGVDHRLSADGWQLGGGLHVLVSDEIGSAADPMDLHYPVDVGVGVRFGLLEIVAVIAFAQVDVRGDGGLADNLSAGGVLQFDFAIFEELGVEALAQGLRARVP